VPSAIVVLWSCREPHDRHIRREFIKVDEKNHPFERLQDRVSIHILFLVRIIDMRGESRMLQKAPLPVLHVPVKRDGIPRVVSNCSPVES
jgi:hypothetical protein